MLDSRFPWLFKIEEASSLTDAIRTKASEFAANVCRRVPGAKCCYNSRTGNLFFYFGEPNGGPLCVAVSHPNAEEDFWPLDQTDMDDCVAVLQLALVPWKDRRADEEKREAQKERQKEIDIQTTLAERRPAIQHHADFLIRKRRGMGKTFVETSSGLILPHDKESSV